MSPIHCLGCLEKLVNVTLQRSLYIPKRMTQPSPPTSGPSAAALPSSTWPIAIRNLPAVTSSTDCIITNRERCGSFGQVIILVILVVSWGTFGFLWFHHDNTLNYARTQRHHTFTGKNCQVIRATWKRRVTKPRKRSEPKILLSKHLKANFDGHVWLTSAKPDSMK
jgi:hypothetical protein